MLAILGKSSSDGFTIKLEVADVEGVVEELELGEENIDEGSNTMNRKASEQETENQSNEVERV